MSDIHSARVDAIRRMMAENGWDAVVISGSDPHGSEYPATRWKQVEWVSGFTGEAGDMVITQDHAGLWTDSRYFIQAVEQLAGSGIELHKTRIPGAVGLPDWVAAHADVVAVDGRSQSIGYVNGIREALFRAHFDMDRKPDYSIVDVPDMLDRVWEDRPWFPVTPVVTLDGREVGESRLSKIVRLRKFLMAESKDAILLSSLDEIAWTLNVRGSDIEYNPLVISYLLVTRDDVIWYVKKDSEDIPDADTVDSFAELQADGVEIKSYDDLSVDAAGWDELFSVFVDGKTLNYSTYMMLVDMLDEAGVYVGCSPVPLYKAVKNAVEIECLKDAYLEDGAAVEQFLYWLETRVASGESVTEWEASQKLTGFRARIPGYRGNSFENISAYGPNAALPHYSTPVEGSAVIEPHGLYLTDSGGQYIFGTTDITRTVPMGECTPLEKEDYTLVLKGMIALAMAVFPEGTAGCQLDVLARNALWRSKRNFGHGTGHGVGFYLCVHEGPQDIRQNFNAQPLLPGMVTSDEPGIYREGLHGVRHENILLCRKAGNNEFGRWLGFETLTCCHIDTSAIVPSLMTEDEMTWLNRYNSSVYTRLAPVLPSGIAEWLRRKTCPVDLP